MSLAALVPAGPVAGQTAKATAAWKLPPSTYPAHAAITSAAPTNANAQRVFGRFHLQSYDQLLRDSGRGALEVASEVNGRAVAEQPLLDPVDPAHEHQVAVVERLTDDGARDATLEHLRLVCGLAGFWELRALQRLDGGRMEARGSFFLVVTQAGESLIFDRIHQGTLEELTRETADQLIARLMQIGRQTPKTAG
jgi:hypothetical protein